jgi:nucleoside 2-deoxyribosyltransferase
LPEMPRVFVSYSHVDKAVARQICQVLDECGIDYFRDEKSIDWGGSIPAEVRAGLAGCDVVVVVVSPASLKSGWVHFEIGHASALDKPILPYLTHPSLDLPAYIRDLRYTSDVESAKKYFESQPKRATRVVYEPENARLLKAIERARNEMPELMDEIIYDIQTDETRLVREFILLRHGHVFNGEKPRFVYYLDEHDNLQLKVDMLEEYGIIREITRSNTPMYRLDEEFVRWAFSSASASNA